MKLEQIKVLMIEDDEDDVLIIEDFIEEINKIQYSIHLTAYMNTEVAINGLKETPYNVILLDLNLIESNGVETLKKFVLQVPHLPIIVLTGLADEQVAIDCIREGASDYLVKGKINADQLKRTIQYSIERFDLSEKVRQKQTQIEKSYQELQQLTYVSSNELREPLSNMIGFSNILLNKYEEVLDNSGKQMLNYLVKESTRHYKQIQSLLNFLEAGKECEKIEQVSLDKLFLNIVADYNQELIEGNAEINFQGLGNLSINSKDAKTLFSKLIENALQFRKTDIPLNIQIQSETLNQQTKIVIEDNGIGIDKPFQEEVFNLFRKINANSESLGMGLSICKKIVESYGGNIRIESEKGKGTKVLLTFPT